MVDNKQIIKECDTKRSKKMKTCSSKYDQPYAGVDDGGGHGASNELPHSSTGGDLGDEHS